jgi:hypothetical protein
MFLSSAVVRPVLGLTQSPNLKDPELFPLQVNRYGGKIGHSHLSSAEVMNAWSYTSNPVYSFIVWWLIKQGE